MNAKYTLRMYQDQIILLTKIRLQIKESIEKFKIFNNNINNCPMHPMNENEYCLRNVTCLMDQSLSTMDLLGFISTKKRKPKQVVCPCEGEYNHVCDKDHCGRNQKKCNKLLYFLSINESSNNQIKYCYKNNTIVTN